MPKLVVLNGGPDTAGVGIGLKQAFDKYAVGWETRAVCRQETYLQYPVDILWPRNARGRLKREVIRLVKEADVLHVMDLEGALNWFAPWLGGKKIVVHHLGTHFRRSPEEVSATCQSYGAIEVTDSLDLMLFPHISFLPTPIDIEALAKMRESIRPNAGMYPTNHHRIRIAHAPTHRAVKSTEQIIRAVKSLSRKYPIDFDLIEGVSNAECLERKARADIFVDQLLLGFGVNNIECWAMGIPVVSGLADPEARDRAADMFDLLPWADANVASLGSVIERLIVEPDWRARLGERGKDHAERWHSQQSVVLQTLAVYGYDLEAAA